VTLKIHQKARRHLSVPVDPRGQGWGIGLQRIT
jgi:hypothetical protein